MNKVNKLAAMLAAVGTTIQMPLVIDAGFKGTITDIDYIGMSFNQEVLTEDQVIEINGEILTIAQAGEKPMHLCVIFDEVAITLEELMLSPLSTMTFIDGYKRILELELADLPKLIGRTFRCTRRVIETQFEVEHAGMRVHPATYEFQEVA